MDTANTFIRNLAAKFGKTQSPQAEGEIVVREHTEMNDLTDEDRRMIENLRLAHERHTAKIRMRADSALDTTIIRTRGLG